MMYGFGPYGIMTGLWSVLLWIILLAIIVKVIYMFIRAGRPESTDDYLLNILKARYAKGEITKEEFDQKKRDLGL
jgi:putative membrane protein